MKRNLLGALAIIAGFAVGYVGAFLIYMLLTGVFHWHDPEGGWGMSVAFAIGPLVGLICAAIAGVTANSRLPRP